MNYDMSIQIINFEMENNAKYRTCKALATAIKRGLQESVKERL